MQRRGRRSGQSAGAATSPADATGADRVSDGAVCRCDSGPDTMLERWLRAGLLILCGFNGLGKDYV